MLYLSNDGPMIIDTNFWESEYNALGLFFLSQNTGASRLRVPDSKVALLAELEATRFVEIEHDRLAGRPVINLWFEDGTANPFRLQMSDAHLDLWPHRTNASSRLLVFSRNGLVQNHRIRRVC